MSAVPPCGMSIGQARKSLWIETIRYGRMHIVFKGQARKSLWIETIGAKSFVRCFLGQARKSLWIETASAASYSSNSPFGQARKSLWIETMIFLSRNCRTRRVRLVRACGSKPGMAHSIPHVNWVRLVRACGSKLPRLPGLPAAVPGQARKSLWIETATVTSFAPIIRVRLVRACGSKL